MPRFSTALTLVFGLVAVGTLGYAWQLRMELAAADADRKALTAEETRLKAELAALKTRRTPARDVASLGDRPPGPPPEGGPDGSGPGGPSGPAGATGGPMRGNGRAAWESPEMQRISAIQRKAALDGRYGALFRKLNLSPNDLERFKAMIVEKQSAATDVFAAARAQGLNPRENRDQIRQLVASSEAEVDAQIQSSLGDGVYQQYKQYEQTMPERNLAGQLEQRLSYSSSPLTTTQTEQLVSTLAASASAAATTNATGLPGFGGNRVAITDATIAAAQSYLTSDQVAALRQIQQEHQAQAQLRQQMQNRLGNTAGGNTPPPPPNPTGG